MLIPEGENNYFPFQEIYLQVLVHLQMKIYARPVDHFCHIMAQFRNKPWFLRVCYVSLFKTLWEEKLLVTSNFSFSHSVLYPVI